MLGQPETSPLRDEIMSMQPHDIYEVARIGLGQKDVIPLWFGESDLNTPEFIKDACKQALDDNKTFYSYARGVPEIRASIVNYIKRIHGVKINDARITLPGSTMLSLVIALECVVNNGDNVVCVSPIWPNVVQATKMLGGEPRLIRLEPRENDWHLDLDRLFDACDARTKAIFLNSPGNPTGWIATVNEQRAILEFGRKHNIAIISDEVYNRLVYEGVAAPSFLNISEPDDLVFIVNGFSKPYAMTGWRLGYMIAPEYINEQLLMLAGINNTGAPVFTQYGGVAALDQGEEFINFMVDRCRKGRDILMEATAESNRIKMIKPEGAFYAFIEIDGMENSLEFAKNLMHTAKVGLAPGSAFGEGNESFLRICFAQEPVTLETAMARLIAAL
ncbi:MAG: pyridoxal phosphate-dependent aminotransferase [Rhizobiaceae bacterium]